MSAPATATDLSQYSPSVAAALSRNAHLAAVPAITNPPTATNPPVIPHHSTPAAWTLLHLDPFSDVAPPDKPLRLPPAPKPAPMFGEIVETLAGRALDHTLAYQLQVGANALWAGTLRPTDCPDAVDNALVRIDALEERYLRYRQATGTPPRVFGESDPARKRYAHRRSLCFSPELLRRVEDAARIRGEVVGTAARFLIECGLILMDERARRYEAWMIEHAQDTATWAARDTLNRNDAQKVVFGVLRQIEPHRYVDPTREGFQQAREMVDPLAGAPATVRRVIEHSIGAHTDAARA